MGCLGSSITVVHGYALFLPRVRVQASDEKGQGELGGLEQRERNLACFAEPPRPPLIRLMAGTNEARIMLNLLSSA